MPDINISIGAIVGEKSVMIDGLGEVKIRRRGSNEDLDASLRMKRQARLIDELNAVDLGKFSLKEGENHTEEMLNELNGVTKRLEEINESIENTEKEDIASYASLLTDDNNGKTVKKLMSIIDRDGMRLLYNSAFRPEEVKKEAIVVPEVENV